MEIDGFDWDKGNELKNFEKHGVAIEEIQEVFSNQPLFMFPDLKHAQVEKRSIAFGKSNEGRLLVVAFTMRQKGEKALVRPISARPMHRKERTIYEKAISKIQDSEGV
ncbi:MAG: BrnT family toxin [Deltaproteobacteria bacterium]|nr:BrnT family toxin [Deltaproteobacteria bacterium]